AATSAVPTIEVPSATRPDGRAARVGGALDVVTATLVFTAEVDAAAGASDAETAGSFRDSGVAMVASRWLRGEALGAPLKGAVSRPANGASASPKATTDGNRS